MPDLEAILFDLYDTLAWSDWPGHASFLAQHMGVSEQAVVSAYDHLREGRDGGTFADAESVLAGVMEHCGLEPMPERVRHLADLEASLLADHVALYEDSLPVLRRLRADGFQTGVISNCSPATRPVVDRLGLETETGVVVLSCEVGAFKPSPDIFRAALEALDVPPGRSLFVDDRADYLDGAANLGMRTVQITRDHAFGEDMEGGEHPRVTDLHQVLDLLR